jgi:hypothetical protein
MFTVGRAMHVLVLIAACGGRPAAVSDGAEAGGRPDGAPARGDVIPADVPKIDGPSSADVKMDGPSTADVKIDGPSSADVAKADALSPDLRPRAYEAGVPLGPVVVSNQTLTGLMVMGYQGWHTFPIAQLGITAWVHWATDGKTQPGPSNMHFDIWPDLSEFSRITELDSRTLFKNADGSSVGLYSAAIPSVVDRHMAWAKEYGIDGIFLQRFVYSVKNSAMQRTFRNKVLDNVMAATAKHGRVFAIEYDISCSDKEVAQAEITLVDDLKDDWKYLVDTKKVTASDRYLRHRGKPLLVIWGLGFDNNVGTAAQANAIVDWFTRDAPPEYQVTLGGGLPTRWRTLGDGTRKETPGEWSTFYRRLAVVHPWMVGRYSDDAGISRFRSETLNGDIAETKKLGIDFLPVVFPGFSNHHVRPENRLNAIPRRGGKFWWNQFRSFVDAGCTMAFGAMFDEVDEATAMYKLAATKADVPLDTAVMALDADGLSMTPDFYLRLAGYAGQVLRGEKELTKTVPVPLVP